MTEELPTWPDCEAKASFGVWVIQCQQPLGHPGDEHRAQDGTRGYIWAKCYHCGWGGQSGSDHSCSCPNRDGECTEHQRPSAFAEALLGDS